MLISISSRSSERAITLCATPAGCDRQEPAFTVTSPSTPAKRNVIQPFRITTKWPVMSCQCQPVGCSNGRMARMCFAPMRPPLAAARPRSRYSLSARGPSRVKSPSDGDHVVELGVRMREVERTRVAHRRVGGVHDRSLGSGRHPARARGSRSGGAAARSSSRRRPASGNTGPVRSRRRSVSDPPGWWRRTRPSSATRPAASHPPSARRGRGCASASPMSRAGRRRCTAARNRCRRRAA